jgi:hypothetical protein
MGITNTIPPSRLIQPGVIDNTAARPASPFEGQCIFQKDTDQLLVWNGTAWVIPNSPAQNPQGLELIATKTFSAVDTLDCTSVFSSTYDDYFAIVSLTPTPAGSIVRTTMLSGSTPAATNYYSYEAGNIWAGTADVTASPSTAYWFGLRSASYIFATMKILQPSTTNYTSFSSEGVDGSQSWQARGVHETATAYDGIRFYNASGNMSGTIRFYGYRK